MEPLDRQIRSAQRRLFARAWAERSLVTVAVGLWLAAVVIAAGRFWGTALGGEIAWLVGAIVAGIIAALAWAWRARPDRLAVAAEIDRRFDLQARVASASA